MLPPFSRDELALIESDAFRRHVSEPGLLEALSKTTADARDHQSASNRLGAGNRQLIESLEHFIATCDSPFERDTAEGLDLKLRAALEAAERP